MKRVIKILLGIVLALGLFVGGMYTGARLDRARTASMAAVQQQAYQPGDRGRLDNPPQNNQDGQQQDGQPSEKGDRRDGAQPPAGQQQDGQQQNGRDNGGGNRQPRSDRRAYGNPGGPEFGGGAPAPRQMGRGTGGMRPAGGMHFLMFAGLSGGLLFSLVVLALAVWGGVSLLRRAPAKAAAPAVAVVEMQPCASCGKPLQADWGTCPFCGSPAAKAEPPAVEEAPAPEAPQAPEEAATD